jgi:predicted ATPase
MKSRKYIKINKLFGKYDNEIDLSSRAIIFIGENGVGKTTMMKILQNLMNFNFNELIKYDFESIDIEVTTKNGKFFKDTIKYEELLPKVDEIKEYIRNSDFYKDDLMSSWDVYCQSISDEDKINYYDEHYSDDYQMSDEEKISSFEFYEREFFYDDYSFVILSEELLKDMINRNELKNIIRKVLKNEKFNDLYYKNYIDGLKENYNAKEDEYIFESNFNIDFGSVNSYYCYNELRETLSKIIDVIKEYLEIIINSRKTIYINNQTNIKKIIKLIKDNVDKNVDILDMTKIYNFENNFLESSSITNELLEWKALIPNKYYTFFKDTEEKIYEEALEQIDGRDFKNNIFAKMDKEHVFNNQSKDILELNNNIIDINSIINHYFYNDDFLVIINSRAMAYYVVANNKDWKLNNQREAKADITKIKDRFIKYIRPILLKNCPFDVEWGSNSSYTLNKIFCNFYTKEWHLFEENINPKIKTLQELLNKYMMNKDVEVTPMGLLVRSKEDNRNIPLNSLSSGEKKLIVIFMHCLFNEDVPIIIDEPEISLSIIWQENLLPDLLEKTNIKQIIVATHSSAVISNSILDKYIIPLPNSIVDKGGNSNE